jgi:hypothetical protein
MAAPVPPQGGQKQHTERPLKIYGEQFVAGGPLPIGAAIDPGDPIPLYADGVPRVLTPAGWVVLHPTDWVVTNRYSGKPIEVISDEEFSERFGGGNVAEET